MKNLLRAIAMVVVLLIASACSSAPAPQPFANSVPVTPGSPANIATLLDTANRYYNKGVDQYEKPQTQLWAGYVQTINTFRGGAHDLIANNASCYANVSATEAQIATAVMGKVSQNGLINALATGGASVSGEEATKACTDLNKQVADFIIGHRQAVQDAYQSSLNNATNYMTYLSDWPGLKITNDLLQANGDDITKVESLLSDHGVGSTDWTWLPTENIWAVAAKTDCDHYLNQSFLTDGSIRPLMKQQFGSHADALIALYEAQWNPAANGGTGECRLYRYAALEFMTRQIVSSDTSGVINSGQDQPLFPTAVPTGQ